MEVEKLEQTLNGGYGGLYGEVVTNDCYRLKSIDWEPNLIVDIGANVGCFARFARELFPHALIVCVEPDYENFVHLTKFTDHANMVFINKALGIGKIHKYANAVNGAHESYFSKEIGFSEKDLEEYEATPHDSITVSDIMFKYGRAKTIIKIDCEGAENSIWGHEPSMIALENADYLVMELHWAMAKYDHDTMKRVVKPTVAALLEISHTHDCSFEGDILYATKI